MPYDKALDKCFYETEVEGDSANYRVAIFSYGNSPPKIRVHRLSPSEKMTYFKPMKNLTPVDAEAVMDGMNECLANWPDAPQVAPTKAKKKGKRK